MSERPGTSVVPWLPAGIRKALRVLQAPNSTRLERLLGASVIDAEVRRVLERVPNVPGHWLTLLVDAIESARRAHEPRETQVPEDGADASTI
jgi:hypothetical protein